MLLEYQMYQMYLQSDYYYPLGELVIAVVFILVCLGGGIQAGQRGESAYENFFCAFLGLTFVVRSVVQLSRGLALKHDSGQETYDVSGVIEEIAEPSFPRRHYLGEEERSCVYIKIGGEKYYSVSLPGISCGDEVCLVVFSKCKFVRKAILIRKALSQQRKLAIP